MKKNISLIICLFSLFIAKAQDDDAKIKPGLKFSPMLVWYNTQISDDAKKAGQTIERSGFGFGYSYGAVVDFKMADNYTIMTELRVSNLTGGFTYTVSDTATKISVKSENTLRLQYLELPVSLKMTTEFIGDMKYFGLAGVQPSFRIKKARADQSISTIPNLTGKTSDENDKSVDTKVFNTFWMIGGGTEYRITNSVHLYGAITYRGGLIDISTQKEYTLKARSISLDLGILF